MYPLPSLVIEDAGQSWLYFLSSYPVVFNKTLDLLESLISRKKTKITSDKKITKQAMSKDFFHFIDNFTHPL